NAAGTGAARHLLAEQVAQRITDDAIEHAPGFLSADAVHVDLARLGDCVLHRGSRDLVERDAEGASVFELQLLLNVPGNRLALAIGVGGEVDAIRLVRLALQLGEDVASGAAILAVLAFDDDVGRHPAVLDVDAGDLLALLATARQIADVAVTRQHLEAGAEI